MQRLIVNCSTKTAFGLFHHLVIHVWSQAKRGNKRRKGVVGVGSSGACWDTHWDVLGQSCTLAGCPQRCRLLWLLNHEGALFWGGAWWSTPAGQGCDEWGKVWWSYAQCSHVCYGWVYSCSCNLRKTNTVLTIVLVWLCLYFVEHCKRFDNEARYICVRSIGAILFSEM